MEVPKECRPPSQPGVNDDLRRSSRAHRSRRTTLARVTKATSGRGSSWDESDSESESKVVGTIHTSDAPWFNVEELYVVRSIAMDEALENFEEACDEDFPSFRNLI
jgi:hypothetical protein